MGGAFLTPKVSWGSKKHFSIENVQEFCYNGEVLFLTPKVSWGSKKHLSIENVQEFGNFASAYHDDQTSYDFQTWIFFISVLRATTYLVARGDG